MDNLASTPSRALAPAGTVAVGVDDTSASPNVAFRTIGIGECRWTSGFWAEKFALCESVMVPHMGTILTGDIGHGLNNFKIAAGRLQGPHQGFSWHDGDFYKWMEAATHIYAVNGDERILAELDEIIEVIGAVQRPDGYLETYNLINGIAPFTHRNDHELYNAGHLLTSACVHHRVTGRTTFLDIAIRKADYLYRQFAPRPQHLARFGFNQSQIMGLVELYRTTRDARYLELAEIFIDMRGASPVEPHESVEHTMIGDMVQERTPLREATEAMGHAVLALYFYAGAADVAAETGERALVDALDRLWSNVVDKKMYLTGACGQTHHGASSQSDAATDFVHEAFISEYMMPNLTAYNETCANIANAMFSARMLSLHGESKYADVMELVMLNSALSGISLDGTKYIYANPLRSLPHDRDFSALETETPDRQPYLECFCCPPNVVRTIAKLSGWAYSLSEHGIAVNLYGGNRLVTHLLDGAEVVLKQETNYPWDGAVSIVVESAPAEPFDLLLRVPQWATGATLLVNGEDAGVELVPGTYATVRRAWTVRDEVRLDLPMEPELVVGHPRIEEVRNQAAIRRGPVVYCVEAPDLPAGASVLDVYLPTDVRLEPEADPDLLGGVTSLVGDVLIQSEPREQMYRPLTAPDWVTTRVRFVPYFAWSNRGTAEMTVWMPLVWR